jgi:hypothetical protein
MPFFLGSGNFVADPLARDLALELREGEQHVQGEPSHRGRGVELLGDRDERHAVLIKELDQAHKVCERAAQPIDLVDDHGIDRTLLDGGEQRGEGRAREVPTREAAVVVGGG